MFECELRRCITNVLDGRDETILQMSNDIRGRSREIIADLKITEKTFQSTLVGICDSLFSQKCTTGFYTSLLIFCMALDSIHKEKSSWYSRDMVIAVVIIIVVIAITIMTIAMTMMMTTIMMLTMMTMMMVMILLLHRDLEQKESVNIDLRSIRDGKHRR